MPFQKGHILNIGKNHPMYGRNHSEETRAKMRLAWKKRPPASKDETREKLSESLKEIYRTGYRKRPFGKNNPFYGKKHTEETKKKLRIARAKQGGFMKGYKHTFQTRLKNSLAHRGEKHPRWKDGINDRNNKIRKSFKYNLWRKRAYKRDNFTCQKCEVKSSNSNGKIVIHTDHIKPFRLILEENGIKTFNEAMLCKELWDTNNGRVLCENCHKKTKSFGQYIGP